MDERWLENLVMSVAPPEVVGVVAARHMLDDGGYTCEEYYRALELAWLGLALKADDLAQVLVLSFDARYVAVRAVVYAN